MFWHFLRNLLLRWLMAWKFFGSTLSKTHLGLHHQKTGAKLSVLGWYEYSHYLLWMHNWIVLHPYTCLTLVRLGRQKVQVRENIRFGRLLFPRLISFFLSANFQLPLSIHIPEILVVYNYYLLDSLITNVLSRAAFNISVIPAHTFQAMICCSIRAALPLFTNPSCCYNIFVV